ncbi:hypothetical protein BDA99DRAFT_534680 [Phascolomyces articulosus]|uniref:Uncharacterized protein n=1 Tax=Phascolomyces articulosus TaxID=60185 RepID=A0AAD5PGX5_9FUNG|nr:hypothetical protein BDA99DRAFT_534680 [Phascolomyces articulosus]
MYRKTIFTETNIILNKINKNLLVLLIAYYSSCVRNGALTTKLQGRWFQDLFLKIEEVQVKEVLYLSTYGLLLLIKILLKREKSGLSNEIQLIFVVLIFKKL